MEEVREADVTPQAFLIENEAVSLYWLVPVVVNLNDI